jgi:mono/diheme cytochrome c family protein
MKLLHLAGRVVLAVLALGAFVIGFAYARTEWLATQRVSLPAVAALTIPLDSATVARGAHLASAVGGCTHCHGSDLGGDTIVNEPLIMRLTAPNLTTGKGGVLPRYENAALDAAIRHGVSPDGRMLIFMPSHEYAGLADDDITAIIAYLRTRPAVDRTVAPVAIGPVARLLSTFGPLPLFPYRLINHSRRPPVAAPRGTTVAHGKYLAQGCVGCHGANLSGGTIPGAPPDWPAAANITPAGIGTWSDADFIRAMRVGQRPDGTAINTVMPWKQFSGMTDDELIALRRYLATVQPANTGAR